MTKIISTEIVMMFFLGSIPYIKSFMLSPISLKYGLIPSKTSRVKVRYEQQFESEFIIFSCPVKSYSAELYWIFASEFQKYKFFSS